MNLYDIFTGLLKAFPLPEEKQDTVHFSFEFNHPKYELLKNKYPILDIAGSGNDFSKVANLMHWISGNIYHKGDYSGSIAANAIDYLDHAFGKDASHGINCVALSTILSDCLLSIGIKARKVFIMPCSPYDGDNHVVAQAYIKEMDKWVMFDPTLNAYLHNEKGEYLSLLELRSHLADQSPVFFNKQAKYNDDAWTEESAKSNIEYLAKNLFYFQMSEINTFNEEDDSTGTVKNRFITLCPKGFNPKQTRINNVEYRRRQYGEQPWMIQVLEYEKSAKYYFCASTDFE
ncbi:MAG: transglutaminase-like domain-containing protein [Defluviitaleaceae bacterium]|nr:transglutaminase-like domain-containing protein [Defluviitaleaceae bacterium]